MAKLIYPASGREDRALPGDVRIRLELLAERRFRSGVVYLQYGLHVV